MDVEKFVCGHVSYGKVVGGCLCNLTALEHGRWEERTDCLGANDCATCMVLRPPLDDIAHVQRSVEQLQLCLWYELCLQLRLP